MQVMLDLGEDIVCAAVSSVAYMTANTITEIIKADTEVAVEDGMMFVKVAAGDALRCRDLLHLVSKLHLIGIEGSSIRIVFKSIIWRCKQC